MMPVERRILIKAASMYYLDHLKQSEIASRMGVDRTTISKYLKKAMKSGIVKIEVESDSYEDLEAALERRFGLREAYVVPKSYDMLAIKQSMAQAGLNLLRRIMADALCIGEDRINIKATTTEGMGFTGNGEGIAAQSVCLLTETEDRS